MFPNLVERVSQALAEISEVRLAYVFGSQIKGTQRKDSDLDIAVKYAPSLDEMAREHVRREIIVALGEKLGPLGEKADVVDLERASSALAFKVIKEGHCAIAKDAKERVNFEVRIIRRYDDDAPLRALIYKAARGMSFTKRLNHGG